MKRLTLGEAAKEVTVSKATLSKALKSGRLSYIEKTKAGYQIDPAELFRVFPSKPRETVESERSSTPVETAEIDAVRRENQLLRDQLDQTRADLEEWRQQARAVTLALSGPNAGPQDDQKRRWWKFST